MIARALGHYNRERARVKKTPRQLSGALLRSCLEKPCLPGTDLLEELVDLVARRLAPRGKFVGGLPHLP